MEMLEQREAARKKAVAAYVEKCRQRREAKKLAGVVVGSKVKYQGVIWKVTRIEGLYAFIARGIDERRAPVGALKLR